MVLDNTERMTASVSLQRRDKERDVKFDWVQYANGPWQGKYVVRKTVTHDYAAFLTLEDAQAFIRDQEKI